MLNILTYWWDDKPATKLSGALWRRDCKRKERLQLHFRNLNICIEKVNVKCWLAEMTLVMTSLLLARVFQHLFTFALVSTSCSDWRKSNSSVDREPQGNWRWNSNYRDVVASSPFLFPPRQQSAPESLLAGYIRWNFNFSPKFYFHGFWLKLTFLC